MDKVTDTEATPIGEEPAPPGHYWTVIKDRRVLVVDINPGQAMVLGGLWRKARTADFDGNFDILGKLMQLFEALIVRPEDREWLEEGILRGEIRVVDFADVFLGEAKPQAPVAAKPRSRVRR